MKGADIWSSIQYPAAISLYEGPRRIYRMVQVRKPWCRIQFVPKYFELFVPQQIGKRSQFRLIQIRYSGKNKIVLFPGDLVVPVAFEMGGRSLLAGRRPYKHVDPMQTPAIDERSHRA